MWLVPRPGIEPVSPALQGRFFTTQPPQKSLENFQCQVFCFSGDQEICSDTHRHTQTHTQCGSYVPCRVCCYSANTCRPMYCDEYKQKYTRARTHTHTHTHTHGAVAAILQIPAAPCVVINTDRSNYKGFLRFTAVR